MTAPCGTYGGYQQHRKRGEETCADCRRASAAKQRKRRAERGSGGGPVGTRPQITLQRPAGWGDAPWAALQEVVDLQRVQIVKVEDFSPSEVRKPMRGGSKTVDGPVFISGGCVSCSQHPCTCGRSLIRPQVPRAPT